MAKGIHVGSSVTNTSDGVNCGTCGYYNFAYRYACRICKERIQSRGDKGHGKHPYTSASVPNASAGTRSGKGQGKSHNPSATKPVEKAWTARKLRELEERNKSLERQLVETKEKTDQKD